ncbi:hypothetical protein [Desulfomicrobium salsuginis]
MLELIISGLDAWLIAPFRWFDSSEAGFFFGIFALALQSVAIGHVLMSVMGRMQHSVMHKHQSEAARRSELAMQALQVHDKTAYIAQNRLAKDAYGHAMALGVGKVTASLCPAVGALGWLDLRFRGVPLDLPFSVPGLGDSVFYPFYFIPAYILVRFCWGYAWRRYRRSRILLEASA